MSSESWLTAEVPMGQQRWHNPGGARFSILRLVARGCGADDRGEIRSRRPAGLSFRRRLNHAATLAAPPRHVARQVVTAGQAEVVAAAVAGSDERSGKHVRRGHERDRRCP